MLHVIERATGHIVEVCAEGSDTSRFDGEDYLIISDAESHDPAGERYDVQAGAFTPISQAELLAQAKLARQKELLATVNNFISLKPDGTARYDTGLKLNLLQVSLKAARQGGDPPQAVLQVEAWISAVQAAYFQLKDALAAASDAAALAAVEISYDWFEQRYGINGSVLADPDVYASDLISN